MIPEITLEQMEQLVRRHLPTAPLNVQSINADYLSWTLRVVTPRGELEFVWGPLTGFGVSDFRIKSENPFAPYDHSFESLQQAETFLIRYLNDAG